VSLGDATANDVLYNQYHGIGELLRLTLFIS
jgi:hypothetical protein